MTEDTPPDSGFASPKDMRGWLTQEILNCSKALDLRLRDAVDFVSEYEAGRLTPEEALERFDRYERRWGEALFGATAGKSVKDEEILAAIDEARTKQWAEEAARDRKMHSGRGIV